MEIMEYTIDRYDEVVALLRRTPGVSLRDADSREATERYLLRNPGLSVIAEDEGRVIGCALCGHDGRRGYLQHVVVDSAFRGKGIANALVEKCLDGLEAIGIHKTHLDVFADNTAAKAYWLRRGWTRRDDLVRYSIIRSAGENA